MLIAKVETYIGTLIAGSVEEGICMFEFSDRNSIDAEYNVLKNYFGQDITEGENDHIKNLRIQISEYFAGTRKFFNLPLIAPGTEFQKKVWNELLNIPYGATRSYQQQADALKTPLSIRAVANANGMNRIAIIIPCHRVIGSNGSLTGYGGGLHRKKWLLDHERKHSGLPYESSLF